MKDIIGYEGLYAACDNGLIWAYPKSSRSVGRFLKPSVTRHGYEQVVLCKDGTTKKWYVHRLVALTYLLQEDGKHQVNHKNGIKLDNSLDNLEWVTPSENRLHAYRTGIQKVSDAQREASRRNITQFNLTKGENNEQRNSPI